MRIRRRKWSALAGRPGASSPIALDRGKGSRRKRGRMILQVVADQLHGSVYESRRRERNPRISRMYFCHGFPNRLRVVEKPASRDQLSRRPESRRTIPESACGSVWLSPLSLYCRANSRRWGGAGGFKSSTSLVTTAFSPTKVQPFEYKFEHTSTVQAARATRTNPTGRGHGARFPTVGKTRPFGSGLARSSKQTDRLGEASLCLILRGYSISHGRKGHCRSRRVFGTSLSNAVGIPIRTIAFSTI